MYILFLNDKDATRKAAGQLLTGCFLPLKLFKGASEIDKCEWWNFHPHLSIITIGQI